MGNSGLDFGIDGKTWSMNFVPENFGGRQENLYRVKYSLVFCAGMASFLQFYEQDSNFGSDLLKPVCIYGETNVRMHRFRLKLLNAPNQLPNYRQVSISQDENALFHYRLYPKRLSHDLTTRRRIDKLTNRCLKMGYLMDC